ncbi:hypothetical protein IPF37_04510 [bacterium]|nr:MAG: hypothetical protein IPF37_04510 [bacterium]
MSRLKKLIEQTTFLMEKQEEAKNECAAIFNDVLSFVEQKINNLPQESEEAEVLGKVYDVLSGQAQKLADETTDDIAFLAEQLKALQHVNDVKDPVKAQELLNMLIDEDEEISDTDVFKEGVTQEAQESKNSLQMMVQDVKDALEEGNFEDVQLLLEALLEEEENEFDDEEEDEEEEFEDDHLAKVMMKMAGHEDTEDGCSSGGCGSCSTGCGPRSEKDFDIFSFVSKYDRELELDVKKDDKSSSTENQA